jgi:ketosteroid isomerase-like protein
MDEHRNVEKVRRAYAAWAVRDMDAAAADWDPDIEWDLTHWDEVPPGTRAVGIPRVMALIAQWMATWRAYEITVESYEAIGENVLLMVRRRARERDTGESADRVAPQLWTFRDGKVVRITSYTDEAEARRAAGQPS